MTKFLTLTVLTFKACNAAIADWWLKNVANATT